MKQVGKKWLCYYCIGCNYQEMEDYFPRRNCKNFVPAIENWSELMREELKKNE